ENGTTIPIFIPRNPTRGGGESRHLASRRGGELPDDLAAAMHAHLVVHVRGRTCVVRDDGDALADLGRALAGADVDIAVFLVEVVDRSVGMLDEKPEARRADRGIGGQRLRACVDDRALAR